MEVGHTTFGLGWR